MITDQYAGSRVAVRLAARMLRPASKLERVAAALNVGAAAVAVVALCCVLGVVGELNHRDAAVVARHPVPAMDGPLACVIPQNTQEGALEVTRFGPNPTRISAPAGAPWPAEGTAWVSPRLAEVLPSDPLLQALVPGTVVGTIGRAALIGPDDLVAYVGVSAEAAAESPCLRVAGFGATGVDATAISLPAGFSRAVTAIALLGVGLGLAVLLVAAAELTAGARERRLAAGVLIGLRPGTLSAIGAINGGALALIGVLAGSAATWPASWLLGRIPLFGVRHWPDVALLPWPVRLAVGAGVVIAGALLGRRTVGQDVWALRRRAGRRSWSRWRLAPLVAGTVLLVMIILANLDIGSQQAQGMSGEATIGLLVALGLAALGLVLAGPVITTLLVPVFGQAPLALRLAVARAVHNAASTRWVSLGLSAGLLGLAVSIGMGADMTARTQDATGSHGVAVVDLPPRASWRQPEVLDDALQAVFHAPTLVWMSAAHTLYIPPPDAPTDPDAPPPEVDQRPFPVTDLRQIGEGDEVQAAMAWRDASSVAGLAAAGWRSDTGFPYFIGGLNQAGDQDNELVMAVTSLGLTFGIAAACLAVGVALIGMQVRRDDADLALLALGVPRGVLAGVRFWETVAAVLPTGLIAMVLSSLAAIAMQHVDNTSLRIQWSMLIPICLVPLALTAGMAALAALTTPDAARAAVRRD